MRERPIDDTDGGLIVRAGALERTPDPQDGRQVVVTITVAGRAMLSEARRSRDAWMFERVRALSEQECAILSQAQQILEKVVAR